MRQNRIAYYADFAAYPVLITVLILLIANKASPRERLTALALAFGGGFLWTLLEYLIHRFVLHGNTRIADLHVQHHAWPRAWIGTPTWLSVAALIIIALLPASLGVGRIGTLGLACGLMTGFLWYGLLHHAIHHGRPQFLAKAIPDIARRHSRHHGMAGIGNFGVTTSLWDRLFQTSLTSGSKLKQPMATRTRASSNTMVQ
jgi:sterol desaturase/sphingolipid hydroxylase (fatty acid hydroxylase superfamily)